MLPKILAASAERRTCVLCALSAAAFLIGVRFVRFAPIDFRASICGILLLCCVALYRLVQDSDGRTTAGNLTPSYRLCGLMDPIRRHVNVHSVAVGLAVLCWLAIGCFRISSPGLHYDEMIFVNAVFPEKPGGAVWKLEYGGTTAAVMVMTYLGAVKGWMYRALLLVVEPTAFAVRFPMLLLAAMTITLTYKLAASLFNRNTGLIAVVLLTTDATFLLTSRLDWGPVVIQRFCLVAGTLLVVRGDKANSNARIAAGFSFFGLALFDKLIFVWLLFGLLAALLATRRQPLRAAGLKRLRICILALAIPASPVLFYRALVSPPDGTAMELHADHYRAKYGMLQQSFEGTVLSGAIAYQTANNPAPARDLPTKAFYWFAPDAPWLSGWFWPAAMFSLSALPTTLFLRGGGNLAFALLFCLLSWVPMALTEGAGSVHHITLVHPFPHIFVAASFTLLAEKLSGVTGQKIARGFLVLLIALIAHANVKNIAHKYTEFIRFGGRPIWTEAIYDLHRFLELRPERRILIADWGIEHQLIFLSRNTMPLTSVPHAGPEDAEALKAAIFELEQPSTLVVRYASKDLSASPMKHDLIDQAARIAGVELRPLVTIHDRQGREMFQIYSVRNQNGQ